MDQPNYYNLFIDLINQCKASSSGQINRSSPLMAELEQLMEQHNQFFYLGDVINLNILFASQRSLNMINIPPDELSLFHFFDITHPDDLHRLSWGRAKLIKMAQDLYLKQQGCELLSTNFRMRNAEGKYSNILIQCYLFYVSSPNKTVFILKLHTNIDWYRNIKNGFHYYYGNDLSKFRFPDAELLSLGYVFSNREFEILKHVHMGLSSEEIAQKLFLSVHTVNTHRRNILAKTRKANITEVTFELQEQGVL